MPQALSVEVTGFKPGSKEDMMEMYFSNKRKSSGGDIASVIMEGDRCIVTFTKEEGTYISLQYCYLQVLLPSLN